jgi:hypothetical protein
VQVGQIRHVRVLQSIFLLLRERRAIVPGDEQRDGVALEFHVGNCSSAHCLGVLAEPGRVPGWLDVYERWRDAQPAARMLVRSSLSGLAETLGPGFARLFAGLVEQGIAPAGPAEERYLVPSAPGVPWPRSARRSPGRSDPRPARPDQQIRRPNDHRECLVP